MSSSHRITPALLESLLGRIVLTSDSHELVPLHAPFTNEVICQVPQCGKADVEQAVTLARHAQHRWASTPVRVRAELIRRLHDLILRHREEMLDLLQLEAGKARRHAFEEVSDCLLTARYYGYHAEKRLAPERRRGLFPCLTSTHVHHPPVGVVGFIVPWNYPLTLAMTDAIPALIAGNAVVVKPASLTPLAALYVAHLFEKAGLPPGLFNVVTGGGRAVGEPLIDRVDFIQFTGSTKVGRSVASRAGKRLIGTSMELGGKNPMLILPDANLKRALDCAVHGCFSNAGQLCISTERIYVHQSLVDGFLDRFGKRVERMKLGSGQDTAIEMGSLIGGDQLETVKQHVDDAIRKGARVVAGGRERPDLGPWFFEPTVLTDVTPKMTLFAEETFGPVVSVYPYRDLHEAIELANTTPYGLNASVFTRNEREGKRVARELQAGTVNINDSYGPAWGSTDAPMGGMKESGVGRRHGPEGLLKYTETQTISAQRLFPIQAPRWLTEHRYENAMFAALKLLKKLPGVR